MTKGDKQKKVVETTKQEEIVVVSVCKEKCGHYDFGSFPSSYKILEHKSLYMKYINARYEFEILHDRLVKIAQKKYKSLKNI